MNKSKYYLAVFIFIVSLFVHLPYSRVPLADGHSWRQTESYLIAKNFVTEWNILRPRTNEMFPIENINRYYFVSFPLYEFFLGSIFKLFSPSPELARLTSIFFISLSSAITVLISFLLLNSLWWAFLSGIIVVFLPLSHYGSAVLSDVMLSFLFSLFLLLFIKKPRGYFFIATLVGSIIFLCKPMVGLLTLPLVGEILLQRNSLKVKVRNTLIFVLAPIFLYLLWTLNVQTISWQTSAFAMTEKLVFSFSDVGSLQNYVIYILGTYLPGSITIFGIILMVFGFIKLFKVRDNSYRGISFASAGFFLWFFSTPNGFYRHDYYLLPGITLVALLTTMGTQEVLRQITSSVLEIKFIFNKGLYVFLVMIIFTYLLLTSILQRNVFLQKNRTFTAQYVSEIQEIKKIIPSTKKVIVTGWTRNPTFLGLTDRIGWVINSEFLEQHTCPPEYYEINTADDVIECYLYPFIREREERGARYMVLIQSEMPSTYEEVGTRLSEKYQRIYSSSTVTVFSLFH